MKIKEIRNKKTAELVKELQKSRDKLRTLRFDLVTKKLKKHQEISQAKRKIARILTVLSERELEEMKEDNYG